jgi:hypothetical protein
MNEKVKKMVTSLTAAVVLMAIVMLASCEKYTFTPPAVDPNYDWSLANDIQPIFNANCVSCHGGTLSPDLSSGKSFNSLTKGGYVNLPAESSELYTKVISSGHTARTTDTEKLKILYWIAQGALNN